MDKLFSFLSFSDLSVRYVTIGVVLITSSSAIVGSFFMFQRKSLVGDAVAHSMLPGLCTGFILAGSKNPVFLLLGAFISGFLSLFLIEYIPRKAKIKEETATSIILSVFFGVGIVLFSKIQHLGYAGQSGLQNFLFGKAASLMYSDIKIIFCLSLTILLLILLLFKEFKLISFDFSFALSIGFPVKILSLVLNVLIILSITVGIQTVGVVLMAAMLITPAAASRFWTDHLGLLVALSAIFGMISGLMGALVSYLVPNMPTGPGIVVIMSIIAFFSFLFSPKKGVISRMINKLFYRTKIEIENILKLFYELGIQDNNFKKPRGIKDLSDYRTLSNSVFKKRLGYLVKHGYLVRKGPDKWSLTDAGIHMGAYVLKLHCLWEAYLTKYLRLNPNHVHEAAESIEHILTPELEKELTLLLDEVPPSGFYDKNPKTKR